MEFLHRGNADLKRVAYLQEVVFSLIDEDASQIPAIYRNGILANNSDLVEAGTYQVQIVLGKDVKSCCGPHAKTSCLEPFIEYERETFIDSYSQNEQSTFREKVLQRDTKCLITKTCDPRALGAYHIVPYSLGSDFVKRVSRGRVKLYTPANGLTMTQKLRTLFDEYAVGVYCHQAQYVLHCFAWNGPGLAHHGQILAFDRDVKEQLRSWLPHRDCLRWHYTQCILTRFRGFYVSLTPLSPMEDDLH